jgi:hypothetical protein
VPTFDTPEPILATIAMAGGSVRISATPDPRTEVEVHPHDERRSADREAAEQTRVVFVNGRLEVSVPRNRLRMLLGAGSSVEVVISLPEGSEVDASGWADYTCEGPLGVTTIETSMGDIRIEESTRLRAHTSMGDISVERIGGDADLQTSAGDVRLGSLEGASVVKTSAGQITVREALGDTRLNTAYGDIRVDRATASLKAKTSAGNIRVGEATGGSVSLDTSYGQLEVGVPEGTAAWLDVNSQTGSVRSELRESDSPDEGDQTVEIRAHNHYGDVLIRRA